MKKKTIMKQILFMICMIALASCNNINRAEEQEEEVVDCCDPHVTLYLQPYADFSQDEAKKLSKHIKEEFATAGVDVAVSDVVVLPSKELPQNAYYAKRNRYLASILLNDLLTAKPKYDEYVIGLTHKDISTKIHGYDNYGIMGLTRLNHHASIVSDYRCKNKAFYKTIIHEFGHGWYDFNHCKDPNCIMCDYQYSNKQYKKYYVCDEHAAMNPSEYLRKHPQR